MMTKTSAILWVVVGALSFGILQAFFVETSFLIIATLTAYLLFLRIPSCPIAILLTGMHLYPTMIAFLGAVSSQFVTLSLYCFLVSSSFLGVFLVEQKKILPIVGKVETVSLLGFATWTILSWLFFAPDNDFALVRIGFVPLLMVSPFLIAQLLSFSQIRTLCQFAVLIGLISIIFASSQFFSDTMRHLGRLATSEESSALWFAYSLGTSVVLGFCRYWPEVSVRMRIAILGMLILVFILLIASGSRGPIVGLFFSLLTVVFLFDRRRSLLYLGGVFGGTLVILPFVSPYFPSYALERIAAALQFLSGTSIVEVSSISTGRTELWSKALELWIQNPLIGIGVGNFEKDGALQLSVHNFIIEILVELGVLGLFLFALYFFVVVIALIKLKNIQTTDSAVAIGLLVYSLVVMFFSGRVQASILFWFSSGLVLSLSHKYQRMSDHNMRRHRDPSYTSSLSKIHATRLTNA